MESSPFRAIQYIAEQRIEEAMAEGAFDNLPGKGQPLHLEDMSNVPEELRMAYKILRNAGCLAPELEERRDINRMLDLLESMEDEKERVKGMEKLRFLLDRSKMRYKRAIQIEEDDPYYAQVIARMSKLQKN
ncbi:MAG: DUF1992 domain-containing protein [Desulfovibrio sp.]|nr:DUF1992 domain-containing protein [Desulfovibrio sp.]